MAESTYELKKKITEEVCKWRGQNFAIIIRKSWKCKELCDKTAYLPKDMIFVCLSKI